MERQESDGIQAELLSLERVCSHCVSQMGGAVGAYLESRKVDEGLVTEYRVGSSGTGVSIFGKDIPADSVVYPVWTPFWGWTALGYRSVGKDPSRGWVVCPSLKEYPRFITTNLAMGEVFSSRVVILCEGLFDALALRRSVIPVVACSTNMVSRWQWTFLSPVVKVVICAFDSDAGGEEGWAELCKKRKGLEGRVEFYRTKPPRKDPASVLEECGEGRLGDWVSESIEPLLVV